MPELRVKQTRSTAGRPEKQRLILKGLGLHGIGTEVQVANTPSFRGMVAKVLHLVDVQEVEASKGKAS
jgi:large subunit ribosomal protein L30